MLRRKHIILCCMGLGLSVVVLMPKEAHAQTCYSTTQACVIGWNGDSTGVGVGGQSTNGIGVKGLDQGSGIGTSGAATNGIGVDAIDSGSGKGLNASSSGGYGVYSNGGTGGWGVYGTSNGNYTLGVYGHGNGGASAGLYGDCTGTSCYALFAVGTSYFSGNINGSGTFNYSSDERLKKDITPLKGSLDKLMELHGVSFYWREPSKHGDSVGIQRGFIAQDYEKVFPEWVTTDADGYKMITTTGLDSLEVESIRTLKAENEALKTQTTSLAKRLEALEAGRRPMNAAWSWMAGMALACVAVVASRRKSKAEG
jgi:hypothetical protein